MQVKVLWHRLDPPPTPPLPTESLVNSARSKKSTKKKLKRASTSKIVYCQCSHIELTVTVLFRAITGADKHSSGKTSLDDYFLTAWSDVYLKIDPTFGYEAF